ncbi:MAG: hypothetical protein HOV81_19120 [Kofleriaceae bacterium]|nr:hypothetical protein [Kofleriaceae bacterium]
MTKFLLAALVCLPLSAYAGGKKAPQAEAKEHVAKATEAHGKGDFITALGELETAYSLDPQPDYLYAIGQVQAKLDRCPDAIASYEKLLASNPGDDYVGPANEAIAACKAKLPPPEPTEPVAPVAPPPPPPAHEAKPFYKDILGDALVAVGVGSGVAGIVMYVGARGTIDDAKTAPTYAEQQRLVDDAHRRRTYSIALGAAGAAVVGVGIWRWLSVSSESTVVVTPTSTGGAVTWMGTF